MSDGIQKKKLLKMVDSGSFNGNFGILQIQTINPVD